MKHYTTHEIKNVVLVGSSKSGKTTLAECMMFEGGLLTRMGHVEEGNTISDFHDIETERKSSVYASILHTEWRGAKLNLVDTPGMDDFIGELISSLRVSDTALLTLNAQYGVEVGTEIIWRYLTRYHKPSVLVVNQIDHAKSDFQATFDQAQKQFGTGVVMMQYPYNQGDGFNAIIDLLKMVMYKFPAGGGKPEKLPIPPEEREKADALHNTLVEAAAEHDETLMELFFEKGELDEDELRQGIQLGMLRRKLFPVFCLSARRNMGSGRLMGFLGNVAPFAGQMESEHSTDGRELQVTAPETTLFVFKNVNEKHAGAMSYFKVCSGELVAGMDLYNTVNGSHGKINQLYAIDGKNRHAVNKLSAGDFGATVKLKDTHVNDTLRSRNDGLALDPIVFPSPRIRLAIAGQKQGDDEKLSQALHKISESDPTFCYEYSPELRQTLVYGQGELHLMIVKWTLKHIYGVEIDYVEPKVPFRETITRLGEGSYKHKKQSGGAGQFAEVSLKVAPWFKDMSDPAEFKVKDRQVIELSWGGKLVFCNCTVGGVIDNRFMPAILKGVMETMEEGPITRSYARDVVVYVFDGKMHPVDSNEISFKIAGQQAFRQAFMAAAPRLMEPIYHLEVLSPEAHTGEILTDLQTRRAVVEGFTMEGNYQKIMARIPLAELHKYSTMLSAITQGRATYTQTFLEYAPVSAELQARLALSPQQLEPA
ncbi:MAG: elongation factor G [Bacteroidetes bacterium]|nr:MAG: elongation factor G [Bacteroidota bacterium]